LSLLTVDPDGGEVWVSEFEGPLDVYDGATLELVAAVDVGEGVESAVIDAVLDPALRVGYVSQNRAGQVLVVDTTTYEVVSSVQVGGDPGMLAVDPLRGRLYVVDRLAGEVKVLGAGP
jgi:YVTN family beta-propeller protein